jgi:hypothetical protein
MPNNASSIDWSLTAMAVLVVSALLVLVLTLA